MKEKGNINEAEFQDKINSNFKLKITQKEIVQN